MFVKKTTEVLKEPPPFIYLQVIISQCFPVVIILHTPMPSFTCSSFCRIGRQLKGPFIVLSNVFRTACSPFYHSTSATWKATTTPLLVVRPPGPDPIRPSCSCSDCQELFATQRIWASKS
ncbi:hypothetical protein C8Q75DRAFT_492394 [Abortiporus biennis]|nr:hypothetical protein C8Q75DRAFT_492394 [Abortiporus biennis]